MVSHKNRCPGKGIWDTYFKMRVAWCNVRLAGWIYLPTIPAITRETVNNVPAHATETDSFGDNTTRSAVHEMSVEL